MDSAAGGDDAREAKTSLASERPPSLHSTLPPGAFEQMARIAVLCLLGVTLAIFAQGLFGAFLWDDVPLIVQNRYVREAQDLFGALTSPFWNVSSRGSADVAYYRPLVTVSYILEWKLYGPRPFGYHFSNLLLHLLCVWLVLRLLHARLLPAAESERTWQALAGAMTGALLFAVHPSRVEVVSWISGRTDLLMALFSLLGLWAFSRQRGRLRGLTAGVAFVVAFLCKESAVVVPLCLLLDVALRSDGEARRQGLAQAAIALGMTAAAAVVRALLVPVPLQARGLLVQPVERVLATIGHYVMCVVWPAEPSMLTALQVRDASGRIAYDGVAMALGGAMLLGFVSLAVVARKRVRARPWLADVVWVAVALVPVLNIVPLNLRPLVANRFLYLPMLGVAALCARAFTALLARKTVWTQLAVTAHVVMLVACAIWTAGYLPAFANDETLTRYELTLHPKDTRMLEAHALQLASHGKTGQALRTALDGYHAAVEQHEPSTRLRFLLLAARLLGDGLRDAQVQQLEALAAFYDALERGEPANLDVPPLRIGFSLGGKERAQTLADVDQLIVPRALVNARLGKVDAAIATLARTVQDNPRSANAYRALALLLAREERHADALAALARAEAAAPEHVETLMLRKRITDARLLFTLRTARADEAVVARAQAFLVLGAPLAALATVEKALAGTPDDALLLTTAARIETVAGDPVAARARIAAARQRLPQAQATLDAVDAEINAFEHGEMP